MAQVFCSFAFQKYAFKFIWDQCFFSSTAWFHVMYERLSTPAQGELNLHVQALSGVPGHSLLWATPWSREDLPAEGLLSGDGEEVQVDLAVIDTLPPSWGRHQIYLMSFFKVWVYLFYTYECFVCIYVCEPWVCFKCMGAEEAPSSPGAELQVVGSP